MTQAKLAQHPSRTAMDAYSGFAGLPPLVVYGPWAKLPRPG